MVGEPVARFADESELQLLPRLEVGTICRTLVLEVEHLPERAIVQAVDDLRTASVVNLLEREVGGSLCDQYVDLLLLQRGADVSCVLRRGSRLRFGQFADVEPSLQFVGQQFAYQFAGIYDLPETLCLEESTEIAGHGLGSPSREYPMVVGYGSDLHGVSRALFFSKVSVLIRISKSSSLLPDPYAGKIQRASRRVPFVFKSAGLSNTYFFSSKNSLIWSLGTTLSLNI